MTSRSANVVVIGNGIAGVTAVDHLRRRHPVDPIDLIAEEPHHLYNRMGIARLVYGKSAMQGLYLNPDTWYGERDIEIWLNTRAHPDRPRQPPRPARHGREAALRQADPGDGLARVRPADRGLRPGRHAASCARPTTRSASAPSPSATRTKKAAVAGGGLLGLEAAYALHQLGMRATVLERSDRLLKRQLDARSAHCCSATSKVSAWRSSTSAETKAVSGHGRLDSIELADGRRMDTELLLVAAGIQPNAELAKAAGLATNRGVLVNARMQTGDPAILAAGDVAEFEGQVPGPVADRGRPGRGRGRRRRRRDQAL